MTAPPAPAPVRPRRSRAPRIVGVTVAVLLTGTAVFLPVLPLVTGAFGPAKHTLTDAVPTEVTGVYLDTTEGVMQLFTWDMLLSRFPDDAPTLPEGAVERLVVVQRAFDDDGPGAYVLYRFDDNRQVPWASKTVRGREMTLVPSALPEGKYLFLSKSDSSFGGTEQHYFAIGGDR